MSLLNFKDIWLSRFRRISFNHFWEKGEMIIPVDITSFYSVLTCDVSDAYLDPLMKCSGESLREIANSILDNNTIFISKTAAYF
jgi:hypothetical protein